VRLSTLAFNAGFKEVQCCVRVAEWLGVGLQHRIGEFDSHP
jgi:hypothetical protein